MTILDTRVHYKPFDHNWAYELFKAQHEVHWLKDELTYNEDIKDWETRLDELKS